LDKNARMLDKDSFKVKVLTDCNWALSNKMYSCTLPNELRFKQEYFEQFYKDQNPNRTLNWLH